MKKTDEVYKRRSQERLTKIAISKIRTTMIGALDSIEKRLGYLWGHDALSQTPDQQELKEEYEALRSEILDKGNGQIRNMQTELSEYEVEWKRYHVDIPIERNGVNGLSN